MLIKFLNFSIYRHPLSQFLNQGPCRVASRKSSIFVGKQNLSRGQKTDFLRIPYSGTKTESSVWGGLSGTIYWRWWSSHHGWLAWFWRGRSGGLQTTLVILAQLDIGVEEEGRSLVKFSVSHAVDRKLVWSGVPSTSSVVELTSCLTLTSKLLLPKISQCISLNKWLSVSSVCHITSQAESHSHILSTTAALASPSENLRHGGPEQELSRALPHRRFEEVWRVQTENRTCYECIRATLQVLRSTVQRPMHGAPIPGTSNGSMDLWMLRLPHVDRRKSTARTRNRVLQILWALPLWILLWHLWGEGCGWGGEVQVYSRECEMSSWLSRSMSTHSKIERKFW